MSARRAAVLFAVAVLGLGGAACNRPLFEKVKPSVERVNPKISSGQFRVLAAIAGGDARIDLQVSVTVRQQLQDSGFTVVRRAGRWDAEADVVRAICAPGESVDGVLFIWYNRLVLRDCRTEGSAAYEITSGGEEGIQQLTGRLIHYLRQRAAADSTPPATPAADSTPPAAPPPN